MKRRRTALLVLFAAVLPSAGAVSLGVSPSSINLGVVERGETVNSQFYLTASSVDQRFLTEPAYEGVRMSTYRLDLGGNYSTEQVNRKEWEDWLIFPGSGEVVDPSTSQSIGGNEFEGEVPFRISVPPDAEPGWYAAKLRVNPRIQRDASGGSVVVRSVARPTVTFRVPGEVTRDIEVVSSRGFRTGESQGTATLGLRNRGTVTAVLSSDQFEVLGPQGLNIESVSEDPGVTIPAGETRTVRLDWEKQQDIEAGNYQVQGVYNHMTGAVFVDQTVQVTDFIQQNVNVTSSGDGSGGVVGEAGGTSTYLILGLLVLLGVLLYSFEIDPVWIFTILGLLGIAAVVFTTGLPMWVLGLTVVGTAVVLYAV